MASDFVSGKYLASGNDVFDASWIAPDNFKAVCPPREKSRWTDGNGDDHVDYYVHRILEVEFLTPDMPEDMYAAMITWFKNHYYSGRSIYITAWCEDEQRYITQLCDLKFTPVLIRHGAGSNIWKATRVQLLGRGGVV